MAAERYRLLLGGTVVRSDVLGADVPTVRILPRLTENATDRERTVSLHVETFEGTPDEIASQVAAKVREALAGVGRMAPLTRKKFRLPEGS